MSHQFKPGDLALIIGSSHGVSPNIGMAVELVQQLETDGRFVMPDGRLVFNRGPRCWVIHANGLAAQLSNGAIMDIGGFALCMEIYLMPLRGHFEPEQQKAKEAEPCA
ncbi:TPA: hypothetical protein QEM72_002676 [Pseudomonas putida]|uniref:hypothetical protein n=1 Tax=Pseudomonas putida TaxID=303 RepID=UPI0023647D45|nr:hypothetical protein [Pseudomonas putida]MDD2076412.1 hypothetical protein [Pseudomonas putida]HDS1692172.1 hypothetical protein [Pseudomonas putida]